MQWLRSRRLLWQIYPVFLLVTVVAIVAVSWYFSAALKQFHQQDSVESLHARAELVALQVAEKIESRQWSALNELCRQAGGRTATRITILLANGQVVGDSLEEPARMEDHSARPEIVAALRGETGTARRFSRTLQQEMMYLAVPVIHDRQAVGVVRTAMATDAVAARLGTLLQRVVAGGIVAILLVAALSLAISRRISRPLEQIKQEAERYAAGQLGHRLRVRGSSEIVALAQTMEQMAHQLSERITTIDKQRIEQDSVLSSMIEGVIAIDPHQNILRLNPAAGKLFDVEPAAVVGRSVQEVVRKAEMLTFITDTLAGEQPLEKEMVLYRSNSETYLQAHGTLLRGRLGESLGALVVFNDLTRLRRLETMRRDFVANVSHELKTPITAIKGFVETLLDGALDSREQSEQFLQIVARQVERLNVIIEDLLNLSRIEQGEEAQRIELLADPVAPVIAESVTDCCVLAERREITLQTALDESVRVALNAPLLEQALTNLIDNAIKYSAPGSTVTIRLAKVDGQAQVQVCDQGCGIEAEHLPRLFERFYRVDRARSRNAGGSGLGLAIVKHIVQIHHGQLTVESTPGQGSIFTIRLPLA